MTQSSQRSDATNAGHARRIVLTAFGSLGDLHPFIAIALGLKLRGHQAVIATSEAYRRRIEPLGIEFRPLQPDQPDWEADPDLMRRLMDPRKGPERIIRNMLMPVIRQSYEDVLAAAEGADLLVSQPLTFAARLVAEVKGMRWASSLLQPMGFFSAYDPPYLGPTPFLTKLPLFGRVLRKVSFRLKRRQARLWSKPWYSLRTELGLSNEHDSLFAAQSPFLVLALFSPLLARKQPDWPSQTVLTGFPFYDRDDSGKGMPPELSKFLADGPPPIVFTLGSSVVRTAGRFFEDSAAAASRLGQRAVLLIGKDRRNMPAILPKGVVAFDYAPFSELFPQASIIVHQAGAGTTGQAMRSGRPMLAMPYSFDQPDNAERVRRLGIARTILPGRYNAARAADELQALLSDQNYATRAAEVGALVQAEDGVQSACDALESLL